MTVVGLLGSGRTREEILKGHQRLLQIDQPDGDPLKTYATFAMLEPAQVCELVAGLGDGVVIHTSDPAADFDLRAACPAAQFTIVHGEF